MNPTPTVPPPLEPVPPFIGLLLLCWFFRVLAIASVALVGHYVDAALNQPHIESAQRLLAGLATVGFLWLLGELAGAVRTIARNSYHR